MNEKMKVPGTHDKTEHILSRDTPSQLFKVPLRKATYIPQ